MFVWPSRSARHLTAVATYVRAHRLTRLHVLLAFDVALSRFGCRTTTARYGDNRQPVWELIANKFQRIPRRKHTTGLAALAVDPDMTASDSRSREGASLVKPRVPEPSVDAQPVAVFRCHYY